MKYNVAMNNVNSSSASNGPNITVVQVAWQTTANTPIAAGDTGAAAVPEPASFAESALGALGLRRWRKSKTPA